MCKETSKIPVNYEKTPIVGRFQLIGAHFLYKDSFLAEKKGSRAYILVRHPTMRNNVPCLNLSPSGTISFLTIEVAFRLNSQILVIVLLPSSQTSPCQLSATNYRIVRGMHVEGLPKNFCKTVLLHLLILY